MKIKFWHVGLATLAMALSSLVPVTASAAANNSITRNITLADVSTGTAYMPYSGDAHVNLPTTGTYTWDEYLTTVGFGPSRQIKLDAGGYSWGCALEGTGASGHNHGINYDSYCYLIPDDSSKSTAFLPYAGYEVYSLPGGGKYTWVSRLFLN